tara:strand:+ start:130 stop:711 length:582 start_codon:yes stop_codon:yes gene_type:complete
MERFTTRSAPAVAPAAGLEAAPAVTPAAAPAPASTVDAAAASISTQPGQLASRNKDIPREANTIMHFVTNWSNKSIVSQATINGLCREMKHMVPKEMKAILLELSKEHDIKAIAGEFKGLFADAVHSPVICWENNGDRITALLDTVVGGASPKNLKKTIDASKLGKLNMYVATLRSYITVEVDEKIRHVTRQP